MLDPALAMACEQQHTPYDSLVDEQSPLSEKACWGVFRGGSETPDSKKRLCSGLLEEELLGKEMAEEGLLKNELAEEG